VRIIPGLHKILEGTLRLEPADEEKEQNDTHDAPSSGSSGGSV
jgi:hypothetical protein